MHQNPDREKLLKRDVELPLTHALPVDAQAGEPTRNDLELTSALFAPSLREMVVQERGEDCKPFDIGQIKSQLARYDAKQSLSQVVRTITFGGMAAGAASVVFAGVGAVPVVATVLGGAYLLATVLRLGFENDLKIEQLAKDYASHDQDSRVSKIHSVACELATQLNIPPPTITFNIPREEAPKLSLPDATQVIFGHRRYCIQVGTEFLTSTNEHVQLAVIAHELSHIADIRSLRNVFARTVTEVAHSLGILFPAVGVGSLIFRSFNAIPIPITLGAAGIGGISVFVTSAFLGAAWRAYESRICEHRMDLRGALITRNPGGTLQTLALVAEQEQGDPRYDKVGWLSDHPTTASRIQNIVACSGASGDRQACRPPTVSSAVGVS